MLHAVLLARQQQNGRQCAAAAEPETDCAAHIDQLHRMILHPPSLSIFDHSAAALNHLCHNVCQCCKSHLIKSARDLRAFSRGFPISRSFDIFPSNVD